MSQEGPEIIRWFTTIALVLLTVLVALALTRMFWRWYRFHAAGLPSPLLLKRDIVLFGTFAVYFGLVLVFRLLGFVLTQNPFWVIPTTLAGLGAIAYWVYVEFRIDE